MCFATSEQPLRVGRRAPRGPAPRLTVVRFHFRAMVILSRFLRETHVRVRVDDLAQLLDHVAALHRLLEQYRSLLRESER